MAATSNSDDATTAVQVQARARAVLLQVAADPSLREEHSLVSGACDDEDLRVLVDLAWRHQFATDRATFRREVADLYEQVARKARAAEEGS